MKSFLYNLFSIVLAGQLLTASLGCRAVAVPEEKITLAVMSWPASTPIYVAYDKGYFRNERLDVTLESYAAGHLALDACFNGKADFATAADAPIARSAIEGKDFAVIATIAEVERPIITIARKDRGVAEPSDLKGKTVGLAFDSAAAYFLHVYLTASYIDPATVKLVDLADDSVVDALLSGRVDAVSTWAPYTHILKRELGDDAAVFSDRDLYTLTWNVVVKGDYARTKGDVVARFLRALVRSDNSIKDNPEEARAVCERYMGADNPLYEKEWKDYSFGTMLDESLILILEDQARWILEHESGGNRAIPNFVGFVETSALKTIRPEAVTIAGR